MIWYISTTYVANYILRKFPYSKYGEKRWYKILFYGTSVKLENKGFSAVNVDEEDVREQIDAIDVV